MSWYSLHTDDLRRPGLQRTSSRSLSCQQSYQTPELGELQRLLWTPVPCRGNVSEVWPNLYIGDLADCRASAELWLSFFAGKVLVHCAMGISRSATLVLAFLMIYENKNLVEALKMVREHRGVCPNTGFLSQLRELDLWLMSEKGKAKGVP
ncbi:dual specificity protein phosphatase 13-like [Notechis scutatus]|uniref:Dual specificity protein phosphatase 13-like n=1 Tax=Notechis scutatus TaxID=8663 RepID=A0A6J1UGE6_9SAUR|nr:dual specificity protein phosphatase 13-like [Notechis scutatus]